jgi:hypothetical protein
LPGTGGGFMAIFISKLPKTIQKTCFSKIYIGGTLCKKKIQKNNFRRTLAHCAIVVLVLSPGQLKQFGILFKHAYLAVGECMHSQIWNNSGSDGSINVIFCEWIEQILNNYFMKFYQICVGNDKMTAHLPLIV